MHTEESKVNSCTNSRQTPMRITKGRGHAVLSGTTFRVELQLDLLEVIAASAAPEWVRSKQGHKQFGSKK